MPKFDSPVVIPPIPLRRNRFLKWAAVLGIWIALGLIYAGPIYLEVRSEGMDHSAARVFGWGVLTWSVWALLTPAIVWLGRRFSLVGGTWKRNLLIHVPAFLIISAIHSAAATLITLTVAPFGAMGESPTSFLPRFLSRMKGAFGSDLLVYGGILGVCYAIDYYQKYREREYLASQLEAQLAQAQLAGSHSTILVLSMPALRISPFR